MKRAEPISFAPGEIISHPEMCLAAGASLQRGMNFRLPSGRTVILMSRRPDAPYEDEVSEDGRTLTYEGHDCSKAVHSDPKTVDQPDRNPGGSLTQNGLFIEAVRRFKDGGAPEDVVVFEKMRQGIWVYNGIFHLIDYTVDRSSGRCVFKFKLALANSSLDRPQGAQESIPTSELDPDDRIIPSWVKLEVWKRDEGKCVKCGAQEHLHFDHIIPYSKGGSSKDPKNIQILCLRHNLSKHDNIE